MNDGIIMKGNSKIQAGQIVVGQNAKAFLKGEMNISEDGSEIDEQLNEISSLLLEHKKCLDNSTELLEIVSSIRDELKKTNPDKKTLGDKLNNLISSVSSVTSLITATNALKLALFAIM